MMTSEPTSNDVLFKELHYETDEPLPPDAGLAQNQPSEPLAHDQPSEPPVRDGFSVPVAEPPPPKPAVEAPKITHVEAMRQALTDLGLEAKNAALAEYLRTRFGIEAKNIAVLKSSAKKTLLRKQENQTDVATQESLPSDLQAEVPLAPQSVTLESESQVEKTVPVESNQEKNGSELPGRNHYQQIENRTIIPKPHQETLPATSSPPPRTTPSEPERMLFSIEEVAEVKTLCDRIGADTVLELLDLFGW